MEARTRQAMAIIDGKQLLMRMSTYAKKSGGWTLFLHCFKSFEGTGGGARFAFFPSFFFASYIKKDILILVGRINTCMHRG
jgi:hypothetical protein